MKPCTLPVAAVTNRDVEAEAGTGIGESVKFLGKQKHFDERYWKRKRARKRLILPRVRSGSKTLQSWGSGSELRSIKLQEDLDAEKLKILPLSHPWFKLFLNNSFNTKNTTKMTKTYISIVAPHSNFVSQRYFYVVLAEAKLHLRRDFYFPLLRSSIKSWMTAPFT